ncbi:MAG: Eco57I restriction-modification methylase domain-containing protein [Gammaproteobacteria bacterium]|nr:Eco57I restriction-modification methylase domain-containing protein [Gammaproteobacteria bacterium]
MRKAKNLGQHFTPEHVADFMIGLSCAGKSARILEPSCGEGMFLRLLEEKGFEDIRGYEIDSSISLNTSASVRFKSFVSEDFASKFDLIIGNPPYIRWKNLDQKLKKELEENDLWRRYFNSLCDYLCIFVLKSVELLVEGGELIFITPEYWINTKHAEALRDYLVENGCLTHMIHFNETPIFNKVASSILIFRFIKSSNPEKLGKKIEVVKYLSTKRLDGDILRKIQSGKPDEQIVRFERQQFSREERWVLAPQEVADKLEEFESKCTAVVRKTLFGDERKYFTLGDIAEIGNGMVSGLDRAFQVPQNEELSTLEKQATITVLKAKNIEQYLFKELSTYIFLGKDVRTEKDLRKNYPTFYELLLLHREKLEKRYSYNRRINYWEWVFLRNFRLFRCERERIFVPCKERISHKDYFRFSYIPSGIFPTQDVTAIFLKPDAKESIFFVLALLNSEYTFNWLRHKGVVKGNIVEFSQKPLASIPIRRINWKNKSDVRLHDDITSLCKSYISAPYVEKLSAINKGVSALF